MTKLELIAKCKKLRVQIPFMQIVDLYKDSQEIPNELIKILFEPSEPKQFVIYMSSKFEDQFNKAIEDYANIHYNKNE